MTRRCVIERWVQRKTDQKLIFNGNYTQIVFFVVFLFQDTLSLCFILFIWFIWSKKMCKHTLTHIISPDQLPKSATLPKWAMLCLIRQHEF